MNMKPNTRRWAIASWHWRPQADIPPVKVRFLMPLMICLLAVAPAQLAHAESFPADSGVINVREYGAKGNGQDDDTAALSRAIAASGKDTGRAFWQDRIVYFPNGTYVVSATLLKRYATEKFASGMILIGQSQARTVIRLKDHAPGFGDPQRPRAVVFTSSKLLDGTATSGGKDYEALGEGNDAYMNFIEDLTIDVGHGNPGAVAIDYLANNLGAVRNVTLRAPADSGSVGLSMTRKWPGPALIQDVTILGFGIGIAVAQTEYGLTFEHVHLGDQRSVAIRNDQNVLAMRDIDIHGRAPAIVNAGAKGFIAIDGGRLSLTESGGDITNAIGNAGVVVTRDLDLGREGSAGSRRLTGVMEGPAKWKSAVEPVWLPHPADAPPPVQSPPGQWANAVRFGAVADPSVDSTDGLRRAFASGAAVVYLPHGTYEIADPIDVPPTVRRVVGMNSTIRITPRRKPDFARTSGMFRIASAGRPVSIEKLAFDNTSLGQQLAIEVSGARDVTIKDVVSAGVTLLDRKAGGGRVFLEDVCCGRIQIAGPNQVLARQLDTEGGGVRILNLGSPLWVLGLKTEGVCTIVEARQAARTDIFGGLVYMVRDSGGDAVPAFRNVGSWLSTSFAEESLREGSRYSVYLADESGASTRTVRPAEFPERGFGRFVPNMREEPRMDPSQ
jgi:Pectate lyase superfamily protein